MLDAAARLFGTQPFHRVRMEDIAAEAGVGKGTLYRYFQDKDELYIALVRRGTQQLLDQLQRAVEAVPGPRQRLTALVTELIAFFDEQPHMLDLIQRTESLPGPDFPWRETRMELGRMLMVLFHEASARADFVVRDPELASLLLLGGLRNVIRFGQRPREHDLPERIIELFLRGAVRGSNGDR